MIISRRFFKQFILAIIAAFAGSLTILAGFYLLLSPKLPQVETIREIKLQTPLRVYSADGVLIGQFGEKRRNPISFEEVPQSFIYAILAAEDDRFYDHPGVDIKGLLRAASQLLQSGHIQTGGSTITMQVARNYFLTLDQTFLRKFNEILLALQIERELSKSEILELYLNKIYLGNRAYGIQAAAQTYYGKDINELSLAQLAMIAGLPKAPSAFNPIANPDRALIRRDWILGRMLQLGFIDNPTHDEAVKQPITASYHGSSLGLDAPYVAEIARKKAVDLLGESAYSDGYEVWTTIDSKLQGAAQIAVVNGLLNYDARHGYRGPETSLKFPAEKVSQVDGPDSFPVEIADQWQKALEGIPRYADLEPAAVIYAHEKKLTVLTDEGDKINIEWANGPEDMRPYISENSMGARPKAVTDFLKVGDVVRIRAMKEGHWQLSQVPSAQSALVALNPLDGAIQSLVGGFDGNRNQFNRATQAERQPGSNFKPFIYTAALENGFTPATLINDAPIVYEDSNLEGAWRPENSSGKFYGPTRMREALYKSRNLVSIRILKSMGIETAIKGMSRFGFNEEELPRALSLALGSHVLSPLQVATGYAVLANGGYRVEPYLVAQIQDYEGTPIYAADILAVCKTCEPNDIIEGSASDNSTSHPAVATAETNQALENSSDKTDDNNSTENASADEDRAKTTLNITRRPAPQVMDERTNYLITDMLKDVIRRGTATKAMALGRHDLAGKTGTTNGPTDAWFSGFNHHIVATAWVGFDQNSLLGRNEYGGSAALPIWMDFMRTALDGVPEDSNPLPQGLVTIKIDPETGMRASPGDPDAIFETFRVENAPQESAADSGASAFSGESLPAELF